jgi:hypothetical protein
MVFLNPHGRGRRSHGSGPLGVTSGFFRLWLHAVRPRELPAMGPRRKLLFLGIVIVLGLHFFGWVVWGIAAGFVHLGIVVGTVLLLAWACRVLYRRKWK